MYVNCGMQTKLVLAIIIYKNIFTLQLGLSYMDFLQYKWLHRNKEYWYFTEYFTLVLRVKSNSRLQWCIAPNFPTQERFPTSISLDYTPTFE